ncbi:MarR family transcriptional regulator [Blautia sp. RD014234]|nr:MarR family transcriptional regulator [Blautia parvula]
MDLVKEINDFYYHMALYELQVMNGNDYYNGLSYNSLLYINVMEQMEECTVSKMADVLKITKSAVTLKINELVKQGVVVKNRAKKTSGSIFWS